MHPKLANIFDAIQQSAELDTDQKEDLLKAVKDADRELEILAFKLERTDKVKKTTAILLEETIEELELKRKAVEEQNRELEIEAALEKVRSAALAMTEAEDMVEVCQIISDQLQTLGIRDIRNVQTVIIDEHKGIYLNYQYFVPYQKGAIERIEYHTYPKVLELVTAIKKSENAIFNGCLEGEELENFREYRKRDGQFPDPILDETTAVYYFFYSIGPGALGLTTYKPLDERDLNIFKRFHNVFSLAYRRFIDIEIAKAQAREAQIEAALERTRTQSMLMQHSNELSQVSKVFHEQLLLLGIPSEFSYVWLPDEKQKEHLFWATWSEDKKGTRTLKSKSLTYPLDKTEPYTAACFAMWESGESIHVKHIPPAEVETFFATWKELLHGAEKLKPACFPEGLYYAEAYMKYGCFGINIRRELTDEEKQVLRRFAIEFERAYTRFLDLQKAEAQAREATKQAALDRVRGEIASMRTAEDLNRITPIIWRELKTLEVPFIRCGVFIVDEERKKVQVYLTTPDGGALGALNLAFNANELTLKVVNHWKKEAIYTASWNKEEFTKWIKSMMELGQVQTAEAYLGSSAPPETLHLHFVPFKQGMLYVGAISPLSVENLDLVNALAEAFSMAYARYKDFKMLEEAKTKTELTLKELKSAQAQLIHSEKMASLGELTAGIAHEIKNPLNFVNNFAELSGELVQELREDLEKHIAKFDPETAENIQAILDDLEQNAGKINEHGKRADSIVKGMLQHSRGGKGDRQLTDINALLEEDLNLAYHGMRAHDSSFNVTMEKKFDPELEKIQVVPQDISRAFLNLITNGFHAVNERRQQVGKDFSPTLSVQTRQNGDTVEIRIKDNGSGIPADIREKIFQPFFTTKPTGQGTGLGLSISYDIVVQEHHGEIRVDSQEGEFTEFIITLPMNGERG